MKALLLLIGLCIVLVWAARRHAAARHKIRSIWHGHVTWERNTSMLRATVSFPTTSAPVENVKVLPPPWLRGKIEAPAGEKDMGGWTRGEFTPEQQARLGVDENGVDVTTAVPGVETNVALPFVYFILLQDVTERVQHVQSMMQQHPALNAKIWPAVTTDDLNDPIYSHAMNRQTFKKVRQGAIGCALSHITLLEHMVSENIPEMIVFEDDAQLSLTFEKDFVDFRTHLPNDFDFGQFLHHKSMKKLRHQAKFVLNDVVMKSYSPYGTVGYYVTFAGAKKMLPTLKPIWYPIDEMFRNCISKKVVNSYMPVNDLVTMPYKYSSNIWKTVKKAPTQTPAKSSETEVPAICKNFPFIWKDDRKTEMLKLLQVAHDMFEQLGIDYVIHSGTALGYARHKQRQIPWDDDIDLYIKARDVGVVKAYIETSTVYCHGSLWLGFKFFKCDSPKAGRYAWSYPMLDIFTITKANNGRRVFKALADDIVWPSVLSEFEGQPVRIPADITRHLNTIYGSGWSTTCAARTWDHENERGTGFKGKLKCTELTKQCGSQWPKDMWPSISSGYDWKKSIDVVIPSALGSGSSDEIERSRTDDHSLYWVLVSFSKYAPWVRTIFIVVNGNIDLPYTLPDNIRVKMVNRCDYMEHCPTYNSQAVYTMIHKIPELSEHFIATQDDIILGRPMVPKDLFTDDGKPFAWRKQPTWNDGVMGAHHRVYVKPKVFNGKTPTSAGPCPHFMYPMLKSFAVRLSNEYADWYKFVESHKEGRFSSETNSINDKRNSQEEAMNGIWESNLITSGTGVYKNIDKLRGSMWDEVSISVKGFAKAIRDKPMFMNVNDRFSKEPVQYKKQVKWFWDAMETLFGVKIKFNRESQTQKKTMCNVVADNDRFERILVIVLFNHAQHIAQNFKIFKELYSSIFPNIKFCSPIHFPNNDESIFAPLYNGGNSKPLFKAPLGSLTYQCTLLAMRDYPGQFDGYISVGDDILMNIPRITALPLTEMWLEQVGSQRFSTTDMQKTGGKFALWKRLNPGGAESSLNVEENSDLHVRFKDLLKQNGWFHAPADMYYFPNSVAESFNHIAPIFLSGKIYFSNAIATIMHLIQDDNKSPPVKIVPLHGVSKWFYHKDRLDWWKHLPPITSKADYYHPLKYSSLKDASEFKLDILCSFMNAPFRQVANSSVHAIRDASWPKKYSPQKNIVTYQLNIKPRDITGRSKVVKQQTSVYFDTKDFRPKAVSFYFDTTGCETKCRFASSAKEADILVSKTTPLKKYSDAQITIHFSREGFSNEGKNIAQFDMTMDMSPLSNIPMTSIPSNFWQRMHDMPIPTEKSLETRKLAVWFGSNCGNTQWPRTQYLRDLSKYMRIDFPGKCLHNTDLKSPRSNYESNWKIYNDYLFVFGFHNALDNRKITEKMFQPFLGNSLNVAMANDIAYFFAPGKNSFVDASRYASPKELAEYLLYLQKHPDEYLKYFEYRKEKRPSKVLAAIQETSIYNEGNLCRVCSCVSTDCRAKKKVTSAGYEQPSRKRL